MLLTQPLPAALLGLSLGVALLLVSRAASRLITPADPGLGLAKVAVAMVLRLALVIAALLAFYLWARPGLVPFGVALAGGFILMTVIELFTVPRQAPPAASARR